MEHSVQLNCAKTAQLSTLSSLWRCYPCSRLQQGIFYSWNHCYILAHFS